MMRGEGGGEVREGASGTEKQQCDVGRGEKGGGGG